MIRYATRCLALASFGLVALAAGCSESPQVLTAQTGAPNGAPGGKDDSGWIGADTFEVNATVTSALRVPGASRWSGIETDAALQQKLVDLQLKFIKNAAEARGWRFNQLSDTVEVTRIDTEGDGVVLHYTAVVDMLGKLKGGVPKLSDLEEPTFKAPVPVQPDGFSSSEIRECSETDDGHSAADYNFHYYFKPGRSGCTLELTDAAVAITEVFDRPRTYPEYDQLMQQLDADTVGFRAALVPNRGDEDPLSRFKAHADMLERELDLVGEDMEDGRYRRYTWKIGAVAMVIDLYDPTKVSWLSSFDAQFRERLGTYTLVHYNGHSAYGSTHLLDDTSAYSDAYQIIVMHSCQSYAYYTRQIFRAKATQADPSGFALADVVATGKSSYPTGSPPTLRILLSGLMDGMVAISEGRPYDATDWVSIAEDIENATWGDIMYGVAGVRTAAWTPEAAPQR